jgi:predicted polyphosphate/ATP-dependent NAD kinase
MATVGLVVNPGASRDVRRLTSLARTIDANEQVNTVARVLCGLAAGGVETVLFMPEPSHVVERARDVAAAASAVTAWAPPRLVPVLLDGDGFAVDAAGTTAAAAAIAAAGAACVVTLGGDGTNRAVAAGWPDAVLIPLAGGTNNAFGMRLDPTAAAYAAALYAAEPTRHAAHVTTRPRLEVTVGGLATIALVDLAVVHGGWVGAHAIWDPDLLVEAIVARSDPTIPGLAGVAGTVHPLGERDLQALHLAFGRSGRMMIAPLGPGQLVRIGIIGWRAFGPGETVRTPDRHNGVSGPVTLAFDGEREITLDRDQVAEVRLVADGPRVLDAAALLRQAATEGLLVAADPAGPG